MIRLVQTLLPEQRNLWPQPVEKDGSIFILKKTTMTRSTQSLHFIGPHHFFAKGICTWPLPSQGVGREGMILREAAGCNFSIDKKLEQFTFVPLTSTICSDPLAKTLFLCIYWSSRLRVPQADRQTNTLHCEKGGLWMLFPVICANHQGCGQRHDVGQ